MLADSCQRRVAPTKAPEYNTVRTPTDKSVWEQKSLSALPSLGRGRRRGFVTGILDRSHKALAPRRQTGSMTKILDRSHTMHVIIILGVAQMCGFDFGAARGSQK